MAHITVEYMILIPFLVLQIFLLPYATNIFMDYWSTSSETIALQQTASHIGSSIQQLYFFLNNPSVASGTVTSVLSVSPNIGNHVYTGNATLVSLSGSSSGKLLKLSLNLVGDKASASTPVTLGQNVQWTNSTFMSNSTSAYINAYKDSNNTIWLSFKS